MYILDTEELRAGDIVLTTRIAPVSKIVRKATSSNFSHAMLYVGNGSYIHSDGLGVHAGNIQRLIFTEFRHGKVLRLKVSDSQLLESVCIFARTQIGKQYSVSEAIKSKSLRRSSLTRKSNRQFCSRLVAQAYAFGGVNIVANPDYCYPQDISDSMLLSNVDGCIRTATDAELQFAASESPLDKQTQATNFILTEVRKLSNKDIQTFEQIVDHLLCNPNHDGAITQIIESSGYLYLWRIEFEKNSWRYNPEIFLALPIERSEKLSLADDELVAAEQQLAQYNYMYRLYMSLWQRAQLQYFALELHLYLKLVELATLRVNAAMYVRKNA